MQNQRLADLAGASGGQQPEAQRGEEVAQDYTLSYWQSASQAGHFPRPTLLRP